MENKIDNVDQLRAAFPELVKAIEETAAMAERQRIKDIESVQNVISDIDLINSAKFEKPMDAKEMVFIDAQAQAKKGRAQLEAMKKDAEPAEAVAVTANAGITAEKSSNKEFENLMAKVKAEIGGN